VLSESSRIKQEPEGSRKGWSCNDFIKKGVVNDEEKVQDGGVKSSLDSDCSCATQGFELW